MKKYEKGELVFCYGTDNGWEDLTNEIDFVGHVVADMGKWLLVAPLFHKHDALIVPKEYVV